MQKGKTMSDCGGCVYFTKLKNMKGNSGLCELHDARTDEDHGHSCNDHKPPKYDRKTYNKMAEFELAAQRWR